MIRKSILLEDWGNLNAVSDEVKRNIFRDWSFKSKLGRNSSVEIVKGDGYTLYNLLHKEHIGIVIRYGQDDLFMIIENYSNNWNIRELNDYDYMVHDLNYHEKMDIPTVIKSESGMVKFFNNIVKFLSSHLGKDKKEIVSKMNFQVIYADKEKHQKQNERRNQKNMNTSVTKNNVTTPSNAMLNKDYLRHRLKAFIDNKLPQFTDVNNIPQELEFVQKNVKFKIFGEVYYNSFYYSLDSSIYDLMKGKPVYLTFRKESYRNEQTFPKVIAFEIKLFNNQIKVTNVYGLGDSKDLRSLEDWSYKKEE